MKHITGAGLDMYCMYNDSGKRIRKTVNGVTTDFYLDGSAILMQTSSDGSRIDFFYDDKGNVFAMKYQNEMYFYRKNLFGDILGILDSHGTELVKYEYNSWGKLLNLTDYSSNGLGRRNPFRFKGYYYDEELGMYYLNSRYYDPETGRMLSPDVLIALRSDIGVAAKNLYIYCDNNPIHRKDNGGTYWHLVLAGVVGAVVEMGVTVLSNQLGGEKLTDGLLQAGITGLCSGVLSATGIGSAGKAIGQGAIAMASEMWGFYEETKSNGGSTTWDWISSGWSIAFAISTGADSNLEGAVLAKTNMDNLIKNLKNFKRNDLVSIEAVKNSIKQVLSKAIKEGRPDGVSLGWTVVDLAISKILEPSPKNNVKSEKTTKPQKGRFDMRYSRPW